MEPPHVSWRICKGLLPITSKRQEQCYQNFFSVSVFFVSFTALIWTLPPDSSKPGVHTAAAPCIKPRIVVNREAVLKRFPMNAVIV